LSGVSMYSGVWVFVEKGSGGVNPVSFELLSKARELSNALGVELTAMCIGDTDAVQTASLAEYGADKILVVSLENDLLNNPEVMARHFSAAINEKKPSVVLAGATSFGRTMMPIIAAEIKTGLTADCTELAVDTERKILLQTRPAFGGNVLATIECTESRPQMATVRPHVFKLKKTNPSKKPAVELKSFSIPEKRVATVLETIYENETLDISASDIIVSGGRGLGRADGFELLQRLANKLGATLGASRGAVDLGWISPAHQVGQTGHTVNPKLYVACGISGAIQHLAGMRGSDMIVAINEDPDAPIFEAADYGIVGNLYEVIPKILEEMVISAR